MTTPESRTVEAASVEERRIERVAEALRRADFKNWDADELAEKIDGTIDALIREAAAKEHGLVIGEGERSVEIRDVYTWEAAVADERARLCDAIGKLQGLDVTMDREAAPETAPHEAFAMPPGTITMRLGGSLIQRQSVLDLLEEKPEFRR